MEKRWFRIAQEFVSLGHEVCHISRRHPKLANAESIEGVEHIRVKGYDQPSKLALLKVLDFFYSQRACRKVPKDADIVVTNTFWSPLLLPRELRSKAYVDVARTPRGQCRLYSNAARLRGNSTPVFDAILNELPPEEKDRVSCIPNPLPFSAPDSIDLEAKEPLLLYCGRVHPEKGLDILMRAASRLPAGWRIEVVGPWDASHGGGGDEYLSKLKGLAGEARVTFRGPVFNTGKLSEIYRRSSLFVYPSVAEQGETFGLAPLEAMAWGSVPIVSSLACFKDFIKDGVNGIIFDHRAEEPHELLAEAVVKLAGESEWRQGLARRATEVGETHSPRRIAQQFVEDFEKIVEK
ncbi:MAG: glycosyltransferase family 4 protein [Verrucomicrobiota bacterium JB023]|nr:glycosyltransferase family 4 protein [Verrucomicrobiota bacterium JB023]